MPFSCKSQGDRRGSNPRPSGPQPDALPTELRSPGDLSILPVSPGLAKRSAYRKSREPRRSVSLGSVVAAALLALALPASSFSVLAAITSLAGVPYRLTHDSEEEQPEEDQGQEQDDQERHHEFLNYRYYHRYTHDASHLLSRGQSSLGPGFFAEGSSAKTHITGTSSHCDLGIFTNSRSSDTVQEDSSYRPFSTLHTPAPGKEQVSHHDHYDYDHHHYQCSAHALRHLPSSRSERFY